MTDSGAQFREFQRQMERFIQRMKRRQRKEAEREELGPFVFEEPVIWPVEKDPWGTPEEEREEMKRGMR